MANRERRPGPNTRLTNFVVGGGASRQLLRLFRWVVTTSWFLILVAVLLLGGSLILTVYTGQWHWFQRSGALLVSIGAIFSTRRPLRLMLGSMIGDLRPESEPGQSPQFSDRAELRICLCGFGMVAMGTLIWAYGDLIGCIGNWNARCLG